MLQHLRLVGDGLAVAEDAAVRVRLQGEYAFVVPDLTVHWFDTEIVYSYIQDMLRVVI